jgi:hypothetical protein
MTRADLVRASLETRAAALKDAAAMVPATAEHHGVNVRESLLRAARAAAAMAQDVHRMDRWQLTSELESRRTANDRAMRELGYPPA